MPKKTRSCLFLPRRKEGEDLDALSRDVRVSHEALEALFQLPVKDAAREIRRFNRFNRPYRKGRSSFNKEVPIALRNAQTGGVDAVLVFRQPAAPRLQTRKLHQAKHAVVASSFGSPFSSIASSSSSATSAAFRATPLETGSPQERSCVEAVMEYLDLGCPISEADIESMLADDFI